jgi:hypothetical protein
MKKTILFASSILLALVMISTIAAFGVSSPYWDGNPLTMARGETKTVNLNLQNMVGEKDVNVKAELKQGSNITSLSEETFTVKAGTSNTMVPLKITMPKDAAPGEVKKVSIEFKTLSDAEGIAMGTGMSVYFDVIANEEIKKDNTLIIIGAIIVVLAIIIFVLKRKK